jgi:hypothetical protein
MRGVACRVWLAGFAGLLLAYTSDLLGSSAGYTTTTHSLLSSPLPSLLLEEQTGGWVVVALTCW